jgi:hypothetical protein
VLRHDPRSSARWCPLTSMLVSAPAQAHTSSAMWRITAKWRRSPPWFALLILGLAACVAAGCGSSSSDHGVRQQMVQQVKEGIRRVQRYVAEHQTSGNRRQAETQKARQSRCQAIPGRPNGIPQAPNPRKALPLKANSIARTVHPALRWNPSLPSRVVSASLHSGGWTIIRRMCGRRVYRRTIYLVVHHPHTGSASLAVSKLFIARFPGDRYRIWYFVHS